MPSRISRSILAVALLAVGATAVHAQAPAPLTMPPRQDIAASTFFGALLGSLAGGALGLAASQVNCPPEQAEIFGCNRPTVLPEIGFSMGVAPGAFLSARGAAVRHGCDPADARRLARRGAVRGLVAGIAPLLAYHLAGGRDERVEWTLALAGSGYQAASVARSTWGCLDAR